MANLIFYVGSKYTSTWGLRAWLALRHIGVPFEDNVIPLYQPDTRARIMAVSPSGQIPLLRHGDIVVWDSLAICEYLAETFPDARLWPEDPHARAAARSLSAEMHSGFQALRRNLSFAIAETRPTPELEPTAAAEFARITSAWRDTRKRFGAGGPFLFGAFTIADAFYAPVASRFTTYGVTLEADTRAYVDAIWSLPGMRDWQEAARKELASQA